MVLKPLKDVLVGALVGIVSMLPGASGATIAVIFGIYERLVSDLADIRNRLLKDLRFVALILIGVVLGMVVCAFGLEFLMDNIEVPTMFFFAALIVAQIPDIMKLGDDGKPLSGWNILAFIDIAFADYGLAFIFSSNFFHNRSNCTARAAPCCPEINHYRLICIQRFCEIRICNYFCHNI